MSFKVTISKKGKRTTYECGTFEGARTFLHAELAKEMPNKEYRLNMNNTEDVDLSNIPLYGRIQSQ
jgi:hypothetical protein